MRIAVTGATGNLGGLVIESLLERGVAASDIVAIARDEAKAADLAVKGITIGVASYEDESALTAAFEGVNRLVLVSGSEVGKRLSQHTNIISAAKTAGIGFIAYTSLLNLETSELGLAPEHAATEKLLAQSGDDYTATLEAFGLPAEMAAMFAGMDPIIAKGALYSESTDLQDLIVRPSTSVSEALS